jgi:hypothetical protein
MMMMMMMMTMMMMTMMMMMMMLMMMMMMMMMMRARMHLCAPVVVLVPAHHGLEQREHVRWLVRERRHVRPLGGEPVDALVLAYGRLFQV